MAGGTGDRVVDLRGDVNLAYSGAISAEIITRAVCAVAFGAGGGNFSGIALVPVGKSFGRGIRVTGFFPFRGDVLDGHTFFFDGGFG